jgi:acetate kinase
MTNKSIPQPNRDAKSEGHILVLNSGSSTIKFSVFKYNKKDLSKLFTGLVDNIKTLPHLKIKDCSTHPATIIYEHKVQIKQNSNQDPYEIVIHEVLSWLAQNNIQITAAGHRVAHGGTKYREATPFTDETMGYLETLRPLAPLHQPYNIKGYKILRNTFADILQMACFDTSFHTTCNKISQLFALPKHLTEQGIRRYGFHGLSYEYIVSQFDKYLPSAKINGKVIIAHLGQGASMCAIHNRQSVATTLGFSALDGLPMGTRTGNIDPGALLYLMENHRYTHKQLEHLLYKESGLLGVSGGISSDMRVLLNSEHPDAKLAVDLFIYKTSAWIGMLVAELQGLDSLVFTAGIGENAAYVREKICERSQWLGIQIDKEKNLLNNTTISADKSKVSVHVIPTDEELIMAKNTLEHLGK